MALASLIALALFASREAEIPDDTRDALIFRQATQTSLHNLFLSCWVGTVLIITHMMAKINAERIADRSINSHSARKPTVLSNLLRQRQRRGTSYGRALDPSLVNMPQSTSGQHRCSSLVNSPPSTPGQQRRRSIPPRIVLPWTWSCVMVSLTLFSYTVPQIVRIVWPFEGLRGVTGAFGNLCFVAHGMMITTKTEIEIRWLLWAHISALLTGVISASLADMFILGFGWATVLAYAVAFAGFVFEFMFLTYVLLPMVAKYNPDLSDSLPETTFRWLFSNGGMTLAAYCYFEAVGIGFQTSRSMADITPWLYSNAFILNQFVFSGNMAATLAADTDVSLMSVLRGKAPWHVQMAFALTVCNSLIALVLFSGREFTSERQCALYQHMSNVFACSWAFTLVVLYYAHTAWRKNNSADPDSESSTRSVLGQSNPTDWFSGLGTGKIAIETMT